MFQRTEQDKPFSALYFWCVNKSRDCFLFRDHGGEPQRKSTRYHAERAAVLTACLLFFSNRALRSGFCKADQVSTCSRLSLLGFLPLFKPTFFPKRGIYASSGNCASLDQWRGMKSSSRPGVHSEGQSISGSHSNFCPKLFN